jgi:dihydrofolate synthase/folylpolyglutamate synthase
MIAIEQMAMDGPGRVHEHANARYKAYVEKLYAIAKSGMTLGLDPIARALEALGHPERTFPAIHVAGSNGKGSTSAFCASILSMRKKTGLYTSPHLISLTERVQIVEGLRPDGSLVGRSPPSPCGRGPEPVRFREITEDAFADAFDAVDRASPGFSGLSFFEAVTAAGLVALHHEHVAAAVIEAGLGARLDATLLVDAHVSVLTDLALEHTEILGDTIEAIAREKSAVARRRRPFVTAGGPPEAMAEIEAAARAVEAPLYVLGREIDVHANADGTFDLRLSDRTLEHVELSLSGPHQGRNALLAAEAARHFLPALTDDEIRRGLMAAAWGGRMEVFAPPNAPWVLLDGAHNPHGIEALVRALKAERDRIRPPLHFVFGVLQDKDARCMIEAIAPLAASLTLTRPDSARARAPEDLYAMLGAEKRANAEVVSDDLDALFQAMARAKATEGWVVVCGSLYLVGAVRAWLLTR